MYSLSLEKAGLRESELDLIFAGDLLNQCVGSSFALRESRIPFYAVMPLSMILPVVTWVIKGPSALSGSGCGCSASVLCGYLLRGMREGRWQRMIFAPTGALLSPTTTFQGESIPGICHAVVFSNHKEG